MSIERSGLQDLPCPDEGMRAWFLNEAKSLEQTLGFSTSDFVTVPWHMFDEVSGAAGERLEAADAVTLVDSATLPKRSVHPDIVAHYAERIRPIVPAIVAATMELGGEIVISRPSPLDEHARPDLSFAGVYKSHMPRLGNLSKTDALHAGTANVLAGRFTQYGNGYYDRHGLDTDRQTGVMFMRPFFDMHRETPLVHGTAYVSGHLIRNEYLISPPQDQPQRDPRLMVRWDEETRLIAPEQAIEDTIDFTNRMTTILDGLHRHFNVPLDVEYLLDEAGAIYVVQIRQIAARHLANWAMAAHTSDTYSSQSSAIVNTVASAEGTVVDLRRRADVPDLLSIEGNILVINHEESAGGAHTQALLDAIREQRPHHNLKVVVDHGTSRVRDHLQYSMVEDPHISFVVQSSDPKITAELQDNTHVRIDSDGLTAAVSRV